MTHTVYSTKAIVLNRVDTAEADITLWLLTQDLGLVVARASGARKEEAKMRNHLQTFNKVHVSLIKGRYVWRITGVESESEQVSMPNMSALATFANISNFVHRMTLNDPGVNLYKLIIDIRKEIENAKYADQLRKIELLAMGKILVQLGYMPESVLRVRPINLYKLTIDINNAIEASHM